MGTWTLLGANTYTGEQGFSANPVIWSNTDITLQLDEDADGTNSVIINDGADAPIFTFQEDGAAAGVYGSGEVPGKVY